MKQIFILLFFLLSSTIWGQNEVLLQYFDSTGSGGERRAYVSMVDGDYLPVRILGSSVNPSGNISDTSYTVAPNGTASAFPDIDCKVFTVTNFTVGEILYVGSSDQVTTANGFPLWYGDAKTYTVANSNQLFHISDGTTLDARCDSEE